MGDAVPLLECVRPDTIPMQWRGSMNGILWSEWHQLHRIHDLVADWPYYQARVWRDGWQVSKIESGRTCG